MDVGMLVVGPSSEVNEDKFHFEPLLEGYMVAGVQAHSTLAEKPFISKRIYQDIPLFYIKMLTLIRRSNSFLITIAKEI